MESIKNKKANFNFSVEDKFEAGIILEGWEIKPILNRKINLDNSHIIVKNGEVFLLNSVIDTGNITDKTKADSGSRTRKLLLNKKEIDKLIGKVERDGYTIIPTKIYTKNNKIKLEIGVAKGKKLYDKRAAEKEKSIERDLDTLVKKRNRL